MSTRTTGDGLVPRDTLPPSTSSAQCDSHSANSGRESLRRVVRVVNPLGLHHRAADRFARAAKRTSCVVTVWNGDNKADGKDLWDLIVLSVFPDSEVILEVNGADAADAAAALDILADILGAPNGEDYAI
jgi:phosphotransferase system HPr (HPr) family protein